MTLRTTSRGTTVRVEDRHDDQVVIVDNPAAPADLRDCEVGRIVEGGFQPAVLAVWALTPEILRHIADLTEGDAQP